MILPGSAPLPPHLTEPNVKPGGSYRWKDEARVQGGGLTKLPPLPNQVTALLTPAVPTSTVPAGVFVPEDGTPYGRKALKEEARKVALAENGTRNNHLNKSAFRLGQLEATGDLPDGMAAAALIEAARATQLPPEEAARTIRSGLRAGRKNPRHLDRPAAAKADTETPPDLHWIDPLEVAPEEIEWLLPKRIALGMPRCSSATKAREKASSRSGCVHKQRPASFSTALSPPSTAPPRTIRRKRSGHGYAPLTAGGIHLRRRHDRGRRRPQRPRGH